MIFVRALNEALLYSLKSDERVVVLGEDILDPYGGAFKATRGLSTAFPERVRTTPVSEGAIAGISAGLALSGFRPIAEIMFGDFITLCFDQIVNHISKYESMYAGRVTCPVVFRTPSGGGRGYGPTHSQSLEKHFLGVPNLRVVAASPFHDPQDAFRSFLEGSRPVLYVEHKSLYPHELQLPVGNRMGDAIAASVGSPGYLPTVKLSMAPQSQCTCTVVAYGYQASLAWKVIERLAIEEEIFAELLIPAELSYMDLAPIFDSVAATKSLVTIEEGTAAWSWGTEISHQVSRRHFGSLRRPVDVVASERAIIPSSKVEESKMLVTAERIERAIVQAAS